VTSGRDIGQTRSPNAAAPGFPARPAFGLWVRARAAVAFIACLTALGSLGSYAWRHRLQAAGLGAAPFTLDPAAWRAVRSVAASDDPSCRRAVPVVILYVSGSCSHCRAELARWSRLVRDRTGELRCTGLAVVAAQDGGVSSEAWLPAELASTLLWDHDRAVARALNVRLVPLAAYVTGNGVVIASVAGESSEASTKLRLRDLRRISDAGTGVH
jgi:hypothetical protein